MSQRSSFEVFGKKTVLGVVLSAVLLASCGQSKDATAQACQAYVKAYAKQDVKAMRSALEWMGQLAFNANAPEDSDVPVLAPEIYIDFLSFGPQPWPDFLYQMLDDHCIDYLAEGG